MATQSEFESRRRERRRRERLRKKRIRAVILLFVLIAFIALGCMVVSSVKKNGSEGDNTASTSIPESTPENDVQAEASASPEPAQTAQHSIPPASEENDLLTILAKSGQKYRCYLTFDDGPTSNVTPQILDILRKYNAKATFFQVGSLIEANPDMARRVYEEGHLVANHSYSHNYDKLYASEEAFRSEM